MTIHSIDTRDTRRGGGARGKAEGEGRKNIQRRGGGKVGGDNGRGRSRAKQRERMGGGGGGGAKGREGMGERE